MTAKPQPQVLKGMRDILPTRMILRQSVVSTLREVFELFGFEPLETPAIEYAETLEGKFGEEADKLIYRFEDRGGRRVGLRYDLTVPLCRVVGMYPDLPKPFKRYQIAPVWRAEKPQKGRYREFYQCDVDTIGSSSILADAEVLAVADFALQRLGFTSYRMKLNDRKILTAIGAYAGVPAEQLGSLYRAIDKLDKIGRAAVKDELAQAGITDDASSRLFELIGLSGKPESVLADLRVKLADSPRGLEGIAELEQLVSCLDSLGISREHFEVDLSMVRGLDYYTGPIFECVVDDMKIGSICGGGRYDNLVGLLSSQSQPAVGITVGLERIVDVLEARRAQDESARKTRTEVLVTVFSADARSRSLELVTELRRAGVNAEVALTGDRLPNQLKYASRKGIPLVAILGPDEIEAGTIVLKNMVAGNQEVVSASGIADAVRASLGSTTPAIDARDRPGS